MREHRRRPSHRWGTGAVARALPSLVLLAVTASCGDRLELDGPGVPAEAASACRALLDALPQKVAGQERREVVGAGYAAAWGDPAIELRCGVPDPEEFDKFSGCQDANGVDWFIPESQLPEGTEPVAITMTTVGRAQNVEVALPEEYFPPVEAMVDLAPALKRTIRSVKPCV